MTADFEQLTYSGEMLKNSWEIQLKNFENFVSNGTLDHGITDFITYILQSGYSERLFAGSSLWTLLISKPTNAKLNYQQTLSIRFDSITGLYYMEYSDWDTIERIKEVDKAHLWKIKCSANEIVERFLEFMEWNKNWS